MALWGNNKHEQFFSSMIETQLQLFDIQIILLKPAGGAKFFEVFLKTAECGRFVFAHFQNENNKRCYTYTRGKFWRFWKYTCYRELFDLKQNAEFEKAKIKIDWSGSAIPHWSERRKFISFEHINQPEPTKKLHVNIKFGFHFETVLPMYGTQKMIFENLY